MSDIKVRFAPSPTGFMHIGNTRTALFNWLLAKKLGGKFMLRIDDTDTLRSKKEYEDAMRESLKWLGFDWCEEARQSARFARYDELRDKLMQQGRIYACYDTPEELQIKRKRAMAKGQAPIYDRQALHYTPEDIARFKAEGRKPHYRFKLNPGIIEWNDIVRGHCQYEAEKLSDPIIIREDGSYLYHFPSCVDDSDFGITHIVRGEDHVTNTAAQIQMFEAIGGKVPTFAHLPLLTGTEGKLSKRLGSLKPWQFAHFWPNSAPLTPLSLITRLMNWRNRWILPNSAARNLNLMKKSSNISTPNLCAICRMNASKTALMSVKNLPR